MTWRGRLAAWYMGRIAGRYCPCEWPIRSKRLIRLCGRIDDAADRYEYHRFAHFVMRKTVTSGTSQTADIEVKWSAAVPEENKPA